MADFFHLDFYIYYFFLWKCIVYLIMLLHESVWFLVL